MASNNSFFGLLFTLSMFALALTSCSNTEKKNTNITPPPPPPPAAKKPDIIVILTDQERYPTHWPEGWAEENLTSMTRLRKHGMTFHRAYTAACECSPSRAVLATGEYSPTNQVPRTLSPNGLPSDKDLMDVGALLHNQAHYDVVWKGKWHLSQALNGGRNWTEKDIANLAEKYDLTRWNPPDAGNAITELLKNPDGTESNGLTTLGGGYANNDSRFVEGQSKDFPRQTPGFGESVLDYLRKVGSMDPENRSPFCLFISLVNPHDIWVYPTNWEAAGYQKEEFANLGIDFPSNFIDDLSTKPSVQYKAREAYDIQSPLRGAASEKEYMNFYAYLNKKVDTQIATILNTLDQLGLTDNTIIIRTADHGELGLSHGMREKAYTAYEEMIHIPFIVSNPKMFPTAQSTQSFYCHLDLLPTLAEIAGVTNFAQYGKGVSIVPILHDPNIAVQDSILFAYDDVFMLPPDVPSGHIRAIRKEDWTYAVYYSKDGSQFEYEMYDLKKDPDQLNNLLHGNISPEIKLEASQLHLKLKEKIDKTGALPANFPWPENPWIAKTKS